MQDHNHQPPPKVRTSALHNTPDTVLHCPTASSYPHIHLLPSTLDPSHLNCEGQPPTEMPHEAPKKLQTPCLAPHNPERKGRPGAPLSAMLAPPIPQGPTGLTQHSAESKTVLPAPAWPQQSQDSPCGFTQLPKWATAANAVHTQVPLLGSSTALPQGHQPSQKEPRLLALARPLCPKQEAGDKHKQLSNLWAPSKPRLSPAGAVPAESRVGAPG